ncbi:MAG: peptidoglycan bridge formation glycyltransferase FemA/FemB family protein [Peptoniphilaceae bacterium]|nr:peptidoglycan bridge formation glycyltransferase FemA/FemB family protein [Peptoniphilaceae bacterium]MDY6019127.1 peptidoglycan bridge formation glycyltransferase FemA/FemB family protein [Anaerococcus sp.]
MPIVKTKEELNRYKEFLKDNPYARPMQDPNWGKIKDNWTQDLVYVEENKQIVAAMAVIGIKNSNGKYFLYAPRGPVCDFKDYDLVDKLIKEAAVLKEKYDAFLLRLDPELAFEERPIYEYKKLGYDFRTVGEDIHSFTQPRYNMIIDTKGHDEESLLNSFSQKGRYNIRKSIKSEIITKHQTNGDTLNTFYELTTIMAQRQGINHRPRDYFERLIKYLDGQIFTSYYKDEALAASILIPYNDKVYYLYAASSNNMRNKMPNYNMIWEELKWTLEKGYRYFDLGGTFSLDDRDGLYKFKEHFCYPHKYTAFIGELDVVYDREKYNEFLNQ